MQLQWFNKSYYHHHFAVTYTLELISLLIIKIIKRKISNINNFLTFEKLKEATKKAWKWRRHHRGGGIIKEEATLKRRHHGGGGGLIKQEASWRRRHHEKEVST